MKGEPKVKLWMELTRQHEQNAKFAARQGLRYLGMVAKAKQFALKVTKEYRRLRDLAGETP